MLYEFKPSHFLHDDKAFNQEKVDYEMTKVIVFVFLFFLFLGFFSSHCGGDDEVVDVGAFIIIYDDGMGVVIMACMMILLMLFLELLFFNVVIGIPFPSYNVLLLLLLQIERTINKCDVGVVFMC